ncbi:KinB-signaling pathway activation protein [Paenibacillus oryzisoli]|uniref:KinB-signaling pathway activation protein n=1 Tax=Paenibacillus oryzisoli TaxID=1850517 RepID=UPI003D27BC85
MTLRKWFHLFWTTLLLGIVVSTVIGLILQLSDKDFSVMGLSGYGFNLVIMILGGGIISLLSQMGFFAYLIVRFIAIGIIRSKTVWELLQLAVIIVVMFDLVYLRKNGSGSLSSYFITPFVILILAVGIGYWKVKLTNRNAFIPTLFFMTVVTVLEAVPALQEDNAATTLFMFAPLIVCNAWQILTLHKILENKKS